MVVCGDLWSFAVIWGGLRWFVVVCLSAIPPSNGVRLMEFDTILQISLESL